MASKLPLPFEPSIGDHVIVPECSMLAGRVGVVVGFHLGRATVAAAHNSNVTVTLAKKRQIYPEFCKDHSDCLACIELAVACARARRAEA